MAELLAANQITIAKVLDGKKGADGEMSAEQLAQLNQASTDASQAKTDASTAKESVDTLSDKTRSGFVETLSGTGFVQSNKTEDGGTSEVVVYGKSEQLVTEQSANLCPKYDKWTLSGGAYVDGDYIVFPSSGAKAQVSVHWKKAYNYLWFNISGKSDSGEAVSLYIGCTNGNSWASDLTTDETTLKGMFGGDGDDYGNKLLNSDYVTFTLEHYKTGTGSMRIRNFMVSNPTNSTYGTYVPFVPDSPSPEYPSEIQNVANPKVTVTAKNLLGGEALADVIVEKGGTKNSDNKTVQWQCSAVLNKSITESISFKENTQYSFILYGKCLNDSYSYANIRILYADGSTITYSTFTTAGEFSYAVTVSTAGKTIKDFSFWWGSQGTILEYEKCGLFEGVVNTEQFEPYKGKTATMSDIVLRSAGEAKDRVFKDSDGVWKVERNVGNVDLGTLEWTYSSQYDAFAASVNTYTSFPKPGFNNMGVCSKYLVHENVAVSTFPNYDDTIFICPYYWSSSTKWLVVRDTSYTDAATFKSAMSGAMLVYELDTSTYETLPDSIQEELNALTTYNPTTNVMVSDGVNPDFDVSFWTRDYRAKTTAETAQEAADNAQTGVDALNNSVYGVLIFEYILDGVTIPAHKRADGTYYYILNDAEVTVAESALVHDADGELKSYQDGGIYDSLNDMSENIGTIDTKVNSFDARETAIYNAIQDNSLIARKNARVEGNSLIITNDTVTEDVTSLLNFLQLNSDSIVIYGNGKDIVTIAKTADDSGYMKMNGTSMLQAQESRLSTIRLRSADGKGNLAFVAGSDGHVSLKEVLN